MSILYLLLIIALVAAVFAQGTRLAKLALIPIGLLVSTLILGNDYIQGHQLWWRHSTDVSGLAAGCTVDEDFDDVPDASFNERCPGYLAQIERRRAAARAAQVAAAQPQRIFVAGNRHTFTRNNWQQPATFRGVPADGTIVYEHKAGGLRLCADVDAPGSYKATQRGKVVTLTSQSAGDVTITLYLKPAGQSGCPITT